MSESKEPENAPPPPSEDEPVPVEPTAHDVHPDDDAHRRAEAQLKRAMADMANLRKRMHKDIDDARRRAIEAMTTELLPVLDNFHLALGVKDQQETEQGTFDAKAVVDGLRMVKSLLESVLERHGLSEIRTEGEDFDPNLHEAVGIDTQSAVAPGQITQVMLRGYRLGDKVLRASRVMVRGDSDANGAPSGRGKDQGSKS